MFKNVEDDLAASPVVVIMVLVVVRLFDVFGSIDLYLHYDKARHLIVSYLEKDGFGAQSHELKLKKSSKVYQMARSL